MDLMHLTVACFARGRKNNEDFRAFKAKMGKEDPRVGGSEMHYITMQRLSSNEGCYQKYVRIGALAMVPLNCEPTICKHKSCM